MQISSFNSQQSRQLNFGILFKDFRVGENYTRKKPDENQFLKCTKKGILADEDGRCVLGFEYLDTDGTKGNVNFNLPLTADLLDFKPVLEVKA